MTTKAKCSSIVLATCTMIRQAAFIMITTNEFITGKTVVYLETKKRSVYRVVQTDKKNKLNSGLKVMSWCQLKRSARMASAALHRRQ